MTEAEWLVGIDSQKMLAFLRDSGKLSERKARLFAVACCRIIWFNFKTAGCRAAVEVVERFADSLANAEELAVATEAVDEDRIWGGYAVEAVYATTRKDIEAAQIAASREFAPSQSLRSARNAKHAAFLHDIFGNPFRLLTSLDPEVLQWHGGMVFCLVQVAYEERELPSGHLDRTRLGVIADALEEVGCDNPEILSHLRGPGSHTRGCWCLDLLLGRS